MKVVFADTFFFLALVNEQDKAHQAAVQFDVTDGLLTTAWVLTEVGDALSSPENRPVFLQMIDLLYRLPGVRIIEPSKELFESGIQLYRERPDKAWSLTDCISFAAMRQMNIHDALTGDRHFEQAGFTALLRQG
jgi:uncharacterized protein